MQELNDSKFRCTDYLLLSQMIMNESFGLSKNWRTDHIYILKLLTVNGDRGILLPPMLSIVILLSNVLKQFFVDFHVPRFTILIALLSQTEGVQVFTSVQIRRDSNDSWKLQTPLTSPNSPGYYTNHLSNQQRVILPPLELLDDPTQQESYSNARYDYSDSTYSQIIPGWRTQYMTLTNPMRPYRYLGLRSNDRWKRFQSSTKDSHRTYLSDGSEPDSTVNARLPWNYRPRCRPCGRPMLQDSFCSDDFVLLVYVQRNVEKSFGERQYKIYVYHVFKDSEKYFQSTEYSRIGYRCDGLQMAPATEQIYLLTGLYLDHQPYVDSCSWRAKWSEVTKQQRRYLLNKYRLHCGICKIQRVLKIDAKEHRNSDQCYVALSPNLKELKCRDRFSLCRYKRQTERCEFNRQPAYNDCKRWLSHRT